MSKSVMVGRAPSQVIVGNDRPLSLISGPCALESRELALEVAFRLKEIGARLGIPVIFKTSFDKANRTSGLNKRGIGIEAAIPIFSEIREKFDIPILTDVHESHQCKPLADFVDILQIPAFLCRQTDLIEAAARTGKPLNIKKGQFLAPWDMVHAVEKARAAGASGVLVTERGASFGYNTLVNDMRALPILAQTTGAPVVFDATHSVQMPGGRGTSSGGQLEFVPHLARAAVAIGVAALFMEAHPNPSEAISDSATQVPLEILSSIIEDVMRFDRLAKSHPIPQRGL